MPIKKDGTGKRWVEMEVLVPGTPEQVWQAMATGPGNAAWFTRAHIEEKVGGALRFEFGKDMSSSGEVTAWEAPHRFAYVEREWSPGAPPVATEITITARSGGQCVVRMVHSLFASSDDWDDQMEGFESGWPGYFEVLRLYLRHFAGRKAASARAMTAAVDSDQRALWARLTQALHLAGLNAGDPIETPAQPQRLAGSVERVHQDGLQRYMLLRLDVPAPAVAMVGTWTMGGKAVGSMMIFFYGDDATDRAAVSEPLWQAWLDETFAGKA